MPFPGDDSIYGWGVVRTSPWHFAGLFNNEYDAQARAKSLGADYTVLYGEQRVGSDDFVSTTEQARRTSVMQPVASQEPGHSRS